MGELTPIAVKVSLPASVSFARRVDEPEVVSVTVPPSLVVIISATVIGATLLIVTVTVIVFPSSVPSLAL